MKKTVKVIVIAAVSVLLAITLFMSSVLALIQQPTHMLKYPEEARAMLSHLKGLAIGGVGWYKPCEYVKLTSPFGERNDPMTHERRFHNGVDLANAEGTPIYAAKSGTATVVSYNDMSGNYIRIDHGDGLDTRYAHLKQSIIKEGDKVVGGQVIGYMGSTGKSTGPHLHFIVTVNGEYVDPMLYISDAVITKEAAERQIFDYMKTTMGFNTAVSCGILANIEAESNFAVTALGDKGTSYGICQWHDDPLGTGRWTNLKNHCQKAGLDDTTLEGQLSYLDYELQNRYSSMVEYFRSLPDTEEGAFEAAYAWCTQFERPSNKEETGKNRGKRAKDHFWPRYQKYMWR